MVRMGAASFANSLTTLGEMQSEPELRCHPLVDIWNCQQSSYICLEVCICVLYAIIETVKAMLNWTFSTSAFAVGSVMSQHSDFRDRILVLMLHVCLEPFHSGLHVILTFCRGEEFPWAVPV